MFDDDLLKMIIRIMVALLLSGIIGFEREINNHSAGFRTHILVGIGSCLMMLLSIYGFEEYMMLREGIRFDPTRIPSYVVSGIGFLGAGTIIVYGGTIRGLTTAASIWIVAGIGLVVGNGMYFLAVFTTIVILLSLIFLNNFEKTYVRKSYIKTIELITQRDVKLRALIALMETFKLEILDFEIKKLNEETQLVYFRTKFPSAVKRGEVYEVISKQPKVDSISDRN